MARQNKTKQYSYDVAQAWLRSKIHVSIEGIDLLPQENIFLKRDPLIVARGQAQAFYLDDAIKRVWILKKFLPGRNPDTHYIKAIQALIPQHPGFESGYQRKVLSQASVSAVNLPGTDFPSWIENTILMPLVKGSDWAYIADRMRDGTIGLTPDQRLLLCRKLSEQVSILERNNISHRDLSSTNIFIDTNTWNVHLIDWDCIYHPSLIFPPNTTFGTTGYIAPFVRVNGSEDPHFTWMQGADRFSLAILNIEFLSIERNSHLTGDGGLFNQDEIYNSGGSGIDKITSALRRNFPQALSLFERVLLAKNFNECPGPDEWITLGAGVKAPNLKDVYDPQPDFLKFIQRLQPPGPVISAPKLSDVDVPDFNVRYVSANKDHGPPAPSLAALAPLDWVSLPTQTTPQAAQPAPRLAELPEPGDNFPPITTVATAPAAPSLSDIEDPFAGANQESK